jgi:DNA-binding response OmpR family regulator
MARHGFGRLRGSVRKRKSLSGLGAPVVDSGRSSNTVPDRTPRKRKLAEERILLVEDERELRELLAIGLRRAGYTVDVAATAAEAQQLIEAQSYALVIADWLLPDGNGIDLADRALEHGAKTLIISGYLFGLPAGAARRHFLLRKPFSIDDLVVAVQNRIKTPQRRSKTTLLQRRVR